MDARPAVRVALLATHPIQYQVPWYCRLASVPQLDLKVFFGTVPDPDMQGVGFDVPFQWDLPLLEGYAWTALENVSRRPGLGRFAGLNAPGVHAALKAWRPNVAILTGWHSLMLVQALWACLRLGVPRLVRGDSNELRPRPVAARAGHRLLMKAFDGFLAVGKSNRAFYERAGAPSERIFDCPHFVDNERFAASAERLGPRRAELRANWRIAEDACCFLFAGKMIAKKRPLDVLAALAAAHRQGAPVHLLVVGSGELLDQARAFAGRAGLPVSFAGFLNQTEMPMAYVAADCLVLASDAGETWGLVVNEAMACGRPAIVSDRVGCGPDLVREGETGAVFPLGDVDALARKMAALGAAPDRLRAMGRQARTRVLADYSIDRAVAGTLAAIEAATGKPATGKQQ